MTAALAYCQVWKLFARLNEHKIVTQSAVEVVAWTNEEGCRFPPCMMGSGVFSGVLEFDAMLARTDAEGVTVSDALDAIHYRGSDDGLTQ